VVLIPIARSAHIDDRMLGGGLHFDKEAVKHTPSLIAGDP
jgi:hypothetical protein